MSIKNKLNLPVSTTLVDSKNNNMGESNMIEEKVIKTHNF